MPAANLKSNPGRPVLYPFAAIAGQQRMRLALILAAIDPLLGGVLLSGHKGTAKSTAARGLAALLPTLTVVKGCPHGCDPAGPLCPACRAARAPLGTATRPTPFADLPLGATEEMVTGSIDLAAAVQRGELRLRPGLLSRAHRGVLYIDEVNLLPAHLAHLVLDAAAQGVARIEREGISAELPASITLIASMNPEEGPLGPQLLDRFGLCVPVLTPTDPEVRAEVLRRRLAFEADPAGFARRWAPAQAELASRLVRARRGLAGVEVPEATRTAAAHRAAQAGAAGSRAELAMVRAVRALAAWRGRQQASPELLAAVAPLALVHRTRPRAQAPAQPAPRLRTGAPVPDQAQPAEARRVPAGAELQSAGQGAAGERSLYILEPGPVRPVVTRLPAREATSAGQAGRRQARVTSENRGRYLRASSRRLGRSLAFDATLRAAAPHQHQRRVPGGPALVVAEPDIREKVRAARRGRLLIFCVDASGSMNAAARMRETKSAVLGLLTEAYQKRDRVGLVAFGGVSAREILPPTASVEVARRLLAELPTGGKTPLAAGLLKVAEVLERELARDPKVSPLVVVLSDGRPNVPLSAANLSDLMAPAGHKGGGWGDNWGDGGYADREVLDLARRLRLDPRPRFVVVDTDVGHHHEINLCRPLADYLGAPCVGLRTVTAGGVLEVVKRHW